MAISRVVRVLGVVLALALLVAAGQVGAQAPTVIKDASGQALEWDEWIGTRTPAAVLVVASWAPGARDAIGGLTEIRRACSARGWELVVVGVQEPFEAVRKSLAGVVEVPWLHDRHGAVLKRYRIIEVPSIFILDGGGAVMDRIDATPRAVAEWEPEAEQG